MKYTARQEARLDMINLLIEADGQIKNVVKNPNVDERTLNGFQEMVRQEYRQHNSRWGKDTQLEQLYESFVERANPARAPSREKAAEELLKYQSTFSDVAHNLDIDGINEAREHVKKLYVTFKENGGKDRKITSAYQSLLGKIDYEKRNTDRDFAFLIDNGEFNAVQAKIRKEQTTDLEKVAKLLARADQNLTRTEKSFAQYNDLWDFIQTYDAPVVEEVEETFFSPRAHSAWLTQAVQERNFSEALDILANGSLTNEHQDLSYAKSALVDMESSLVQGQQQDYLKVLKGVLGALDHQGAELVDVEEDFTLEVDVSDYEHQSDWSGITPTAKEDWDLNILPIDDEWDTSIDAVVASQSVGPFRRKKGFRKRLAYAAGIIGAAALLLTPSATEGKMSNAITLEPIEISVSYSDVMGWGTSRRPSAAIADPVGMHHTELAREIEERKKVEEISTKRFFKEKKKHWRMITQAYNIFRAVADPYSGISDPFVGATFGGEEHSRRLTAAQKENDLLRQALAEK